VSEGDYNRKSDEILYKLVGRLDAHFDQFREHQKEVRAWNEKYGKKIDEMYPWHSAIKWGALLILMSSITAVVSSCWKSFLNHVR